MTRIRLFDTNRQRDSRFELLRIVAALMIMFHHAIQHGGKVINGFTQVSMTLNQIISVLLGSYGQLGVAIFIIIGAWFRVDKVNDFSSKGVFKVLFQSWFTAVIILIICFLIDGDVIKIETIIKSVLTPFYTGAYWFVSVYIVYCFAIPVMQNALVGMDLSQLKTIVVISTILVPIYNFFANNVGSQLADFCYIFLLTAYLKKKSGNFIERHHRSVLLGGLAIYWMMMIIVSYLGTTFRSQWILDKLIKISDSRNIVIIIIAFAFFYTYRYMNLKPSKYINLVAKTALGTYLISENFILRGEGEISILWNKIWNLNSWYQESVLFVLYLIGIVLITFILCVILDLMRIKLIEEPLFKCRRVLLIFRLFDDRINSTKYFET